MNLRKFPGVEYPIGSNYSEHAMPASSPYAHTWWYRTEFSLPPGYAGKTVWLNFKGINYKANLYLNGKQIADATQVIGAWRTYEFKHVTVTNPSQSVAFFIRLKVTRGKGGDEILPVVWQDNYISLLPGEERDISATYRTADQGTSAAQVAVQGWNVETETAK